MIETWLSYDLTDLLMFSPRVYYRQLELANAAAWPLQFITVPGGLALALWMVAPSVIRNRIAAGLLAVAWVSSCWFFLVPGYTGIHWAGWYVVALFLSQAAALGLVAVVAGGVNVSDRSRYLNWLGALLVGLVSLAYPLLAVLSGRSIAAAEVFGIAADPTALATLIIIALGATGWQILLVAPAWIWLAISASSLWAMGSPEAWILLAGLLAAPAALIGRGLAKTGRD